MKRKTCVYFFVKATLIKSDIGLIMARRKQKKCMVLIWLFIIMVLTIYTGERIFNVSFNAIYTVNLESSNFNFSKIFDNSN